MPNRRQASARPSTKRSAEVVRIDQARVALRQLKQRQRAERATRTVIPVNGSSLVDGPSDVVVVFTANSVWIVTCDEYRRMPRHEFAVLARAAYSEWGRLDDNVWLSHRGAAWVMSRPGYVVNIRPTAGPVDGYGIVTGTVEAAVSFSVDFA